MARTCALIVLVQPILHRISCSTEILPNTPKHYETHQNMRFGSNGVDLVRSLRKIPTSLRGTNFCINCTSSPNFAPSSCSYEMIPNATKHYETHQNMSLGSNGVDRVHSLQKIPKRFCSTNLCINCTSSTHFAPSFVQ